MEFIETKKNWIQVELRQVCDFIGGSQPSKKDFIYEHKLGYIRLIQIRDYKSNDYLTFIPLSKAKRLCSKDDVMIGRYGPPLFQILRGLEGAYNVALIKAKPINNQLLDNNFLCYFLKTNEIRSFIIQSSERTVGQDGVRKDLLEQYPIPLPPLNEQHRIVAKLEQLLSRVQSCQERLDRIPKILKRFRQSVLAAACSGRLTEDWREQNADISLPEGQNLPNGWKQVTLQEVIQSLQNGLSKRASNVGIPTVVLRLCDLQDGQIANSNLRKIGLNTCRSVTL